jgi:hypothetical protein
MVGSLINRHKSLQRIKTETEASACEAEAIFRQGKQTRPEAEASVIKKMGAVSM